MKKLLFLTFLFSSLSLANDIDVRTIEHTSKHRNNSITTGFIINDDHPTDEVKIETTYSKNGVISFRTSTGDGNDKTGYVDYASQQELNAVNQNLSQAIHSSSTSNLRYIEYVREETEKNAQAIGVNKAVTESNRVATTQNRIKNQQQDVRLTKAEQEIYSNTYAISQNKRQIDILSDRVDRLEDKVDSVLAASHAVTNSRPFINSKGDLAFGVGLGRSSDANAIAVSSVYAITNNFTTSLSISATTGYYDDVSGGVGFQLKF